MVLVLVCARICICPLFLWHFFFEYVRRMSIMIIILRTSSKQSKNRDSLSVPSVHHLVIWPHRQPADQELFASLNSLRLHFRLPPGRQTFMLCAGRHEDLLLFTSTDSTQESKGRWCRWLLTQYAIQTHYWPRQTRRRKVHIAKEPYQIRNVWNVPSSLEIWWPSRVIWSFLRATTPPT
jgi:hypothetical protein